MRLRYAGEPVAPVYVTAMWCQRPGVGARPEPATAVRSPDVALPQPLSQFQNAAAP